MVSESFFSHSGILDSDTNYFAGLSGGFGGTNG